MQVKASAVRCSTLGQTRIKKILICDSCPVIRARRALLPCIVIPAPRWSYLPGRRDPPAFAGTSGKEAVKPLFRLSSTAPDPQSASAKTSRPVLPLFAKHTYTHMHRGVCCFFSIFFLSFFSSRSNPEPGPGLPLRCSLAHKHKTAFIILPVAAQGLASKSY